MDLEQLTDEQLIERARAAPGAEGQACLDTLFRRFYPKVAYWCLRVCGDREAAADLAQEVFLRVHDRLDSFRGESRFSTWVYTVTRRVAIDQSQASRRRLERFDTGVMPEVADPSPDAEETAERAQIGAELRRAMERDLEPQEAEILYLHYVLGLTLPAITDLMKLRNKSGAKAFIVSGRRKLERRFGRWLARQSGGPTGGRP